jgi:N-acetylglucosaminyldiphosphoundecaprenol N-acetyl-beta-D-mannosaminyltransferase
MRILGVQVSPTSYGAATAQIRIWAQIGESYYICIANVHVLMEAHDSNAYMKVLNQADLLTPDGMPLVWMLRLKGVKGQTRVYGPTLMLHVLEMAVKEQIPVGFYGADQQTLENLGLRMHERFPGLLVAYSYSPPFRPLNNEESVKIIETIKASGTRILFVGLGCPKQEKWMADHKGKIPAVMLGVGAAFDFHAGSKHQAPFWIQRTGLEWLFRLIMEPGRLWRRYMLNNPRFIFLAILDLLGLFRFPSGSDR